MNYVRNLCGLLTAIDDAGIHIKSFKWEASSQSFDIDVNEDEELRAGEIAQEYWRKQQEVHMEHIGLIAVPTEST